MSQETMNNSRSDQEFCIPSRSLYIILSLVNLPALAFLICLFVNLPSAFADSSFAVLRQIVGFLAVLGGLTGTGLLLYNLHRTRFALDRASLAWEEQVEIVRGFLATTAAGVFLCDNEGRIDTINDAGAQLFGYSAEEMKHRRVAELFRSDSTAVMDLSTGDHCVIGLGSVPLIGIRKDGSHFPVALAAGKIRRARKTYFTGILQDLTELHQTREMSEAANRAKTSFLVNVSHEFRTPLNGILGMTQALMKTTLTEAQSQMLTTLSRSAESLAGQLTQLLDFARLELGNLQLGEHPFSLRELIEETLQTLEPLARAKALHLCSHLPADLPTIVLGDSSRLRQILVSLLANAVKFTNRGEVYVRLFGKISHQQYLMNLEVRDTGIGIYPEKQQQIFTAFEQGDTTSTREYSGLGLGLALVSRLVRLMNGNVSVDSVVGVGSTFRVSIPFKISELVQKERVSSTPEVLIVVADPEERLQLSKRIQNWGMSSTDVGSSQSALTQFCEAIVRGVPFALMIVADSLPDGSACELLTKLQSWQINCPTILLRDEDVNRSALPAMVLDVLPQKCTSVQLRDSFRQNGVSLIEDY